MNQQKIRKFTLFSLIKYDKKVQAAKLFNFTFIYPDHLFNINWTVLPSVTFLQEIKGTSVFTFPARVCLNILCFTTSCMGMEVKEGKREKTRASLAALLFSLF